MDMAPRVPTVGASVGQKRVRAGNPRPPSTTANPPRAVESLTGADSSVSAAVQGRFVLCSGACGPEQMLSARGNHIGRGSAAFPDW